MFQRARRFVTHPGRVVAFAFLAMVVAGSTLLTLPVFHPGRAVDPLATLFTATSALCVTGLAVVDTATYWSTSGQVVILLLIQIGGYGIMTLATLLSIVVTRRLGLRTRLTAAAESRAVALGEVRTVLRGVAVTMAAGEALVAAVLTLRWWLYYDEPLGRAAWLGVFHAVAGFCNAGFTLFSDSLEGFVGDPWICLPLAAATIAGGLGFPVLFELRRSGWRPRRWSVHTRLTVWASVALLAVGTLAMYAIEWRNPATLGQYGLPTKLLAGFFQGVQPRSSGFSTLDYSAMHEESWLVQTGLMFVGGGSASTAGGIKVTTFMLLAFVILAEVRGQRDVTVGDRRIPDPVQREALSVALVAVGAVALGTLALLATSSFPLGRVLFEATSAFGLAGLSTGITPHLGPGAQLVLVLLMYVGRVGPVSAASFLALRERDLLYRYPEARPLVG